MAPSRPQSHERPASALQIRAEIATFLHALPSNAQLALKQTALYQFVSKFDQTLMVG